MQIIPFITLFQKHVHMRRTLLVFNLLEIIQHVAYFDTETYVFIMCGRFGKLLKILHAQIGNAAMLFSVYPMSVCP